MANQAKTPVNNAQPSALPFKLATRRYYTSDGPLQSITSAGGQVSQQVPKTGFLSKIRLNVTGSITLANSNTTSATVTPSVFWPWNLLQNIKLHITPTDLFNMDGFGAWLVKCMNHIAYNGGGPETALNTQWTTSNQGPTAIFGTTVGSISIAASSSAPVTLNQTYAIPVAVDDQLKTGLIDMQANGMVMTLSVTAGNVVDWFGTLPSGVTVSAINITVTPQYELFAVPDNAASYPDTNYFHVWRYDDVAWSSSGDQIFNPDVGNVFLRVLARLLNGGYNGTPYQILGTAGNPATVQWGNTQIKYTGLQNPEIRPAVDRLQDFRELHGFDLPDGVIPFDFRDGGGSVELGWDPRDNYNTRKMTYFNAIVNVATTPNNGSIIRWYREELVPVVPQGA